jgi:hypothetical protein
MDLVKLGTVTARRRLMFVKRMACCGLQRLAFEAIRAAQWFLGLPRLVI